MNQTMGSFQVAAMFRFSWKVPSLVELSPKQPTVTELSPMIFEARAEPAEMPWPAPTMPLAPRWFIFAISAMCMEPPLPLQ